MFKKRRSWWMFLIIVSSLMLFFVGREWASWRPQLISRDGLKIVAARANRELARSKSQMAKAKKRFSNGQFQILAVSPDRKWIACDYRKLNIYDCALDIRDAQSGKLKSKLKFDNAIGDGIESVEFSPSGNYLVINFGYDNFRAVYDLRDGQRAWINIVSQVVFPPDEKMIVCVRLTSGRHGGQSAFIWTSSPKFKSTIRQIPVPAERIALPIGMDGPNHIIFSDTNDNLWRVRIR